MEPSNHIPVIRIIGDTVVELDDRIATETAFTLIVDGTPLVSLLCSPIGLDHLAVGFLFSEGLISGVDAIQSLDLDEATSTVRISLKEPLKNPEALFHTKAITSGCGKGITFTDAKSLRTGKDAGVAGRRPPISVTTFRVKELLTRFYRMSELYKETGGVHSAAIADPDDIRLFAEDIGRHNAVDKLIGNALLANIPLDDKMLLCSGRISGEIMTKAVRSRIPVLISRTAPTCMSISYAEDHGVTLIGFARGNRMNIYTHPFGIVFTNLSDNRGLP